MGNAIAHDELRRGSIPGYCMWIWRGWWTNCCCGDRARATRRQTARIALVVGAAATGV